MFRSMLNILVALGLAAGVTLGFNADARQQLAATAERARAKVVATIDAMTDTIVETVSEAGISVSTEADVNASGQTDASTEDDGNASGEIQVGAQAETRADAGVGFDLGEWVSSSLRLEGSGLFGLQADK